MTIKFINATTAKETTGDTDDQIVIDRPAGIQFGDLLVMVVMARDDVGTLNLPAGFTSVGPQTEGTRIHMEVGWLLADDSEPDTYTVSWGTSYPDPYANVILAAYRGCNVDAPIQSGYIDKVDTSADPFSVGSTTLAVPGTNLTIFGILDNATSPWTGFTAPTGMNDRAQTDSTGPDLTALALFDETMLTAGPTGARVTTAGQYDNTALEWIAYNLALDLGEPLPYQPILEGPTDGATIDRAEDLDLEYAHQAQAGVVQAEAEVRYRRSGLTSWTTVGTLGTASKATISGGTLAAGVYEWQARTSNSDSQLGPWSFSDTFIAGDKPAAPTWVTPADSASITTATLEGSLTHPDTPDQLTVQILDLDDNVITETITGWDPTPLLVFPQDINFAGASTGKVRARVTLDELTSDWDTHTIGVDYPNPQPPTIVLTEAEQITARILEQHDVGYGGTSEAANADSPQLVPDAALVLPGVLGDNAREVSAVTIHSSWEFIARVHMYDYTSGTGTIGGGNATHRGLSISATGAIIVRALNDSVGDRGATSGSAIPAEAFDRPLWVRGRKDWITGDVDFAWSADQVRDREDVVWIDFATVSAPAGLPSANQTQVVIGTTTLGAAGFRGALLRAYDIRNDTDVVEFDPLDADDWILSQSADGFQAHIVDGAAWMTGLNSSTLLHLPIDGDTTDWDDMTWVWGGYRCQAQDADFAFIFNDDGTDGFSLFDTDTSPWFLSTKAGASETVMDTGATYGLTVLAGSRQEGTLRLHQDGLELAAASGGPTGTITVPNAETDIGVSQGTTKWVAMFQRYLTDAEHLEIGTWNGKLKTIPSWVLTDAVRLVVADDPAQQHAWTDRNRVLSPVGGHVAGLDDPPPEVDYAELQRQQSIDDGATWTNFDGTVDAWDTVASDDAAAAQQLLTVDGNLERDHVDYLVASKHVDTVATIYRYRILVRDDQLATLAGPPVT